MKSEPLQTGGSASFEDAARAAYPALWKAAFVLLDNSADAEDAVQETILRACRAYGSFRGGSSPTTWMYAILMRVAADFRRGRRPMEALDEDRRHLPARTMTPDALAEADDESRRLLEHLRALPHRQKEIVTLFYLEDLSYQQVAGALGVSVGTVKSALSRARAALRETLTAGGAERKVDCELP